MKVENEITSILLLPTIRSSESLRGYMYKTAQVNAYPKLFLGVPKVFDSVEGFMQQVARRDPALKATLGARIAPSTATAEALPEAFHLRLGEEWIPEKYFLMLRRKVCPLCLNNDAWARGEWELRSLTACARHKVELVTKCPTCHRELAWISTELLRCGCGQPLEFIQTVPASVSEVSWAKRVEQALLTSIRYRVTKYDLSGGPVQIRLSKLLLMAEIVRSVILPKYLKYPANAEHRKELVTEVLEDTDYRPYLWETVFSHAASNPFTFSKMLRLGQEPKELARSYAGIVSELMVPRSLKPLRGPVLDRPLIVFGRTKDWKEHLARLRRFYTKRLEEGRDPFSPLFPRGLGDPL